MSKILLFLLISSQGPAPQAANTVLIELRKSYYKAVESRTAATQFMNRAKSEPIGNEAVSMAYNGMAHLLMAKFAINPYHKLSYFNEGKTMLDSAVYKAPQNLEVRFMRFIVQTNAPFFLNYRNDLQADKAFIIRNWTLTRDADLKQRISEYMVKNRYCKEHERRIFTYGAGNPG